jgi:hypothetical protein
MIKPNKHQVNSIALLQKLLLSGVFLALVLAGCKSGAHTSDPRLRQIDQMLDSQLPQGTPKSRVIFFLGSQNFPVENATDRSVVAIIHRVDTDTLQPATARVTFHFDASDKLKSYELEQAAGTAPQP